MTDWIKAIHPTAALTSEPQALAAARISSIGMVIGAVRDAVLAWYAANGGAEATRIAVDQMTRSMAVALAPRGIRVNAVAIGSVLSGSLQAALKSEPDWRGLIEAGTPLGRVAPAAEIVETVQYLASDASSFLTGQVLTVDGGRSLLDAVAAPAH